MTPVLPAVIVSERFAGDAFVDWHFCGGGGRVWHASREIESYPLTPGDGAEALRYASIFRRNAMGDA